MSNKNDSKVKKVWLTLLTCAPAKNMLFEVVPSFSTDSCIRSFKRFIIRRGCPKNLKSDTGNNIFLKKRFTLYK